MSTLVDPKFTFTTSVDALTGELRRNPDADGSGWSKIWFGLSKTGVYCALCLILVTTLCLSLPKQLSVTPINRTVQIKPVASGNQVVRQAALTAPMPALIYKEHASLRHYLRSVSNVPDISPDVPSVRGLVDMNATHRAAATGEPGSLAFGKFNANAKSGLLSLRQGKVKVLTAAGGVQVPRLLDKKMAGESGELKPVALSGPDLETGDRLSLWNDTHTPDETGGYVHKGLALVSPDQYEFCRRLPGLWNEGVSRMPALAETLPPDGTMLKRSSYYRKYVDYYAVKYKLDAPLIMAIMHTESNFNPFAVSKSNALGLMQIVPETAGVDVYAYLTGKRGRPSQATLLEAEYNIQYGITYLHLLNSTHFRQILDTASREMCVIAAYNGGPGAVLRVFDDDKEVAFATINSMAPDEVYEALTSKMPSLESRRYVETVLGHMKNYN